MGTCYKCGRPIPSTEFKLRRKVKTGESVSRRYPNPNISAIRTTYGVRLVCSNCARSIDWRARREELIQYLELSIAILVLLVALAMRYLGWP